MYCDFDASRATRFIDVIYAPLNPYLGCLLMALSVACRLCRPEKAMPAVTFGGYGIVADVDMKLCELMSFY
jgi:hypothetical protein